MSEQGDREIVDRFFELWWRDYRRTLFANKWMGIPTIQNPFDVWITQEILTEVRPEIMIEAGTNLGGSAVLWATILEQLDPEARLITIDVKDNLEQARRLPIFERKVDFLHGSTTDPVIIEEVARRVRGKRALVLLDSAHTREHVSAELEAYAPLVSPASYLIVQDTFVNGHPVEPDWGPGPWEAVIEFLARHPEFEVDRQRERLMFTFCPNGYLRRRSAPRARAERAGP